MPKKVVVFQLYERWIDNMISVPVFNFLNKKIDSPMEKKLAQMWSEFYNGKDPFFEVKFFIDTEYQWGEGWGGNQVAANDFQEDIIRVFNEKWQIILPRCHDASALSGERMQESLYFHPMEISGEIRQESIEEIAETIQKMYKSVAILKEIRVVDRIYPFERDGDIVTFMFKNRKFFFEWILGLVTEARPDYEVRTAINEFLTNRFFKHSCTKIYQTFLLEEFMHRFLDMLIEVKDIKVTVKKSKLNGDKTFYKAKAKNWLMLK